MNNEESTIAHNFKRGDSISKISTDLKISERHVKYVLSKLRKKGTVERWWK